MIQRILVGLGGTPFAKIAGRRAVELAQAHHAEVTAVTLMDRGSFDESGFYGSGHAAEGVESRSGDLAITLESLERSASDLERACRDAGVNCSVLWESGDPLDLLVSASRYHDLVICGLRGLFDYGVTANPKDSLVRLIRRGVQPILAVAQEYRAVERVLIAYSGSPESARALKTFVQLKAWPRCDLYVAAFHRDAKEGNKLLTEAAAYCKAHGYEPRLHHSSKPAEKAILETAHAWPADLIVMGDGAHGVWTRKVLGDTLQHIVRNADRPLFLAH